MDWSWSARCAVGEFRSRLFSSQAIPPNMCGTEPQQLRFWSSRNHQEAICWIASMRHLRNMHSCCRRASYILFPNIAAQLEFALIHPFPIFATCKICYINELGELNCHFRFWYRTDMAQQSPHVCYWGKSGRHLLAVSISPFDPGCVKTLCCCYDSLVILWGN